MTNYNLDSAGWILCENSMPEELYTHMLVTRELTYYFQYVSIASWSGDTWYAFEDGGLVKIDDVIAWQPLPEPYDPHPDAIKELEKYMLGFSVDD